MKLTRRIKRDFTDSEPQEAASAEEVKQTRRELRRQWWGVSEEKAREWRRRQAEAARKQAEWRRHGVNATFTCIVHVKRPAVKDRPRCGARCRDGHPCQAPVVWPKGAWRAKKRCRRHGGMSTGPKTAEGKRHTGEAARQRLLERWRRRREARGEPCAPEHATDGVVARMDSDCGGAGHEGE